MNRIMLGVVSLLLLASAASGTTQYIGVNITGENPDGDWGYSVIGPSVLAPGDFVFGQDHWNNQPNSAGWQNHDQGSHRDPLLDSTGAPVGTMTISSDDRPLAGCRYNGDPGTQSTGSSGFAFPATLEQVLYNGLNYNMNNGVISVTLTNGVPADGYTMNIFGSGGTITVHDATNNLDYTTPGSLGAFATPGMQSVTLPATTGSTVYTFGAHGNWDNHLPPWNSGNSPLISAFQFVSAGAQTAPNFTADPGAGLIAFGNVGVSTTATQTVTLNNIGTAAGDVTSASVSGDFILSSGTAPISVAALGWAAYDIQLPAKTLPGAYSGTAHFVTATGNFDYTLSATVIAHDGDVNGDGQVSLLDYNIIKVNFGNLYESGNHWGDGDVNGDLQVGLLDFNIVKAHFGHTTGDVGVTAVPEPATLSLLALAGLAALRRKR